MLKKHMASLRIMLWLSLWLLAVLGLTYGEKQLAMLMPDVQPKVKDTYLCTSFKMPRKGHEYIIEFHPNATMDTAHHILIYGCGTPGYQERDTPRAVWACGEMAGGTPGYESYSTCETGSQIVYAWAMDAPALVLPAGVGFKVGGDTGINYLVLQVHYASIKKFVNGGTDNSGIILTIVPGSSGKVTKRAGVLLLGTGGIIPARRIEYMESACTIQEPIEIHPFAFRTHTHKLGLVVSGYLITENKKWELIGKHDPRKPQMFYPVKNKSLTIHNGQVVAARCTMNNSLSHAVSIGATSDDEMCNFYMMYYVDGDRILENKYCFTSGPPLYRWGWDVRVGKVPANIDRDASTLDDDD